MGNIESYEKVKAALNKFLDSENLSLEEKQLLKSEIRPATVCRYTPWERVPNYLNIICNLYKYDTPEIEIQLKSVSRLAILQYFGLFSVNKNIRRGELKFNPIPANTLSEHFLHTARHHPLRPVNNIFSGDDVDHDLLKHLAWTDEDADGNSGILIFMLHNKVCYTGGITVIDNTQHEYRMKFANMFPMIDDEMDKCHVHSLFIRTGDIPEHEKLIQCGMLNMCYFHDWILYF